MLEHSGQNLKVTCSVCFLVAPWEGVGELGEDILLVSIWGRSGVAIGRGSYMADVMQKIELH